MRKLITVLTVFVLLLSCSVTAFAAEECLDENKTQTEIGVYAKAEYNVEGVRSAPIEDGNADVATDDGTSVSVTDAPDGAVRLMVVPVHETEKEAWEWIEDCMKDKADPVHTFNIYFEDKDGNRINADGAVITINCPHCDGIPVVCSLKTDGTVQILNRTDASGTDVMFTTDGSTYYVMAEKLPTSVTDPDSPQTGDNGNLWLWWLLLIISAMGTTAICFEQKKYRAVK